MSDKDFDINIDFSEVDGMITKIQKQLKGDVLVSAGYFHGSQYPNGLEVAENALIQEYGTQNIPARPFLSNAVNKNEDKWKFLLESELDKGRNINYVLNRIGQEMRNDIVHEIDKGLPPPNADSTIKQKGSSQTLIDTGLLRRSTTYSIGNK